MSSRVYNPDYLKSLQELSNLMHRINDALSALLVLTYTWHAHATEKKQNAGLYLRYALSTNFGSYGTATRNMATTRDTLTFVNSLHSFTLDTRNALHSEFVALFQAIRLAKSTRSLLPEIVAREWVPYLHIYTLSAIHMYNQAQPAESDIHGMSYYRAMTEYLAALKACEAVFCRC